MYLPTKNLNEKIWMLFSTTGAFFLLIIFRLFYLQIHLSETLREQGKKNFTRIHDVSCLRGNITDINGKLLATNRPVINIYWQGNQGDIEKTKQIFSKIYQIIGREDIETLDFIRKIEKYSQKYLIATDITIKQLSQIVEIADSKNLIVENSFQRFYPFKSVASHILGYLGQIDLETMGKMGLEKLFEEDLKGSKGKNQLMINSTGKKIQQFELEQPVNGKAIKTTLDINIQKILEQAVPTEYSSAAILMESKSGAIRAIVSRPSFDPSIFLKPVNYDEWFKLQQKKLFINRAFNAAYPPASIFKLITMIAALEEGIVGEETVWNCKGHITFGKRKFHCNKLDGHGLVDLKQAIIYSCNVPLFEIGKKLKVDTIAKYAQMFGLGQKTGILFAEQAGLVPTTKWKMETKGERWWPGETLSVVIGQSFLLTTPIQIAVMLSALFEENLIKPKIIENAETVKTPINLSKKTLEIIKDSMKLTVTEGTAKRLNKLENFDIYAKTGTAQTGALGKRTLGDQFLEHVWFVGQIKHEKLPDYSLVILLENVGAARVVTNTAKRFLIDFEKHIERHDSHK